MRCKRWRTRCALAGAAAVLSSGWARAADYTMSWIGDPGSWADPLNWTGGPGFPNNGANTFNAIIGNPSAVVTLNSPITINNLDFRQGTMNGGGELTLLEGAGGWGSGTISGSGTINIKNSFEFYNGQHNLALFTFNIDSAGSILWSDGDINAPDELGGGGILNNAGLFEDQTDSGWYWNSVLSPVLNNTGTYRKSAGSSFNDKFVNPAFNNSGFVDVQTANLWLSGGGNSSGSYSVASGATLKFSDYNEIFNGPTTVFSSSVVVSSLGTVMFANDFGNATTEFNGTYDSPFTVINTDDTGQAGNGGQVKFMAGAIVNTNIIGQLDVRSGNVRYETGQLGGITFGDVSMTGGQVDTVDDLFFGSLNFSSGTISGAGTTSVSAANIYFTTTDPKHLKDVNLYNGVGGFASISEGSVVMSSARIVNLTLAQFDLQGNSSLVNEDPMANLSVLDNSGTVIKSGASTVSELAGVYLYNNGTVIVQSGTLRLNGGGNHTGTFQIASGATLELGQGAGSSAHTLLPTAIITGAANSELRIIGPTIFEVGSRANLNRLTVDNAYLDANGTVTASSMHVQNAGQVYYTAGSFSAGAMQIVGGSQVTLLPGNNKVLQTTAISIDAGSKLDLSDNKAIVAYTGSTPIDNIRQKIINGYNGGAWTGNGITSSSAATDSTKALGYGESSELGTTTFGGVSLSGDNILIRYTYNGDANLSGFVDVADLLALAKHWNTSSDLWTEGDFNYDGSVNIIDLKLLANNWGASFDDAPPILDMAPILTSLGLPAVAVPEPAAVGAFLMTGALLRRRRRRR